MSRADTVIAAAIAEGILPAGSMPPAQAQRPWPVILLTALGAWLAAVPLMIVLFIAFDSILTKGPMPYIIGCAIIGGTVFMLRSKTLPLFLEQLALPALLVGGGILGVGMGNAMDEQFAVSMLAVLACVLAAMIPRNWLRTLLGAAACGMVIAAVTWRSGTELGWAAMHLVLALWLFADMFVRNSWKNGGAEVAAALDTFASGWVVVTLAGLAAWSGMTFLAGASLDDFGSGGTRHAWLHPGQQLASLALGAAAAGWIGYRWPSLRAPWCVAAGLVVAALAWFMPALGASLLVLAVLATASRWRLAIAAGLTAAWIVGAFYYQLSMPLAIKSGIMVGAGALLGMIAWFALGARRPHADVETGVPGSRRATVGIALCAAAVLAVANIGIWQKENLIAQGKPVFVELAPVDPRSLMQGDYMQLDFGLTRDARAHLQGMEGKRVTVVAAVDARGVATFARRDDGRPLGPGEMQLEIIPDKFGWKVASNAWYFKEGEAERWQRAKFGEFRVDASGKALLTGMRGPQLEPL